MDSPILELMKKVRLTDFRSNMMQRLIRTPGKKPRNFSALFSDCIRGGHSAAFGQKLNAIKSPRSEGFLFAAGDAVLDADFFDLGRRNAFAIFRTFYELRNLIEVHIAENLAAHGIDFLRVGQVFLR
jgi:hypothetical protein